MEYRYTCKWCGKQFDSNQASRGGVTLYSSYCSKRCEIAAERERQRKEEEWRRKRDERRQRKDEIMKQGGLSAKLLAIGEILKWSAIIIGIIGLLCYFLYLNRSINASNSSIHSNERNIETIQETVKKQLSVNDNVDENGIEVDENQNTGVEPLEVKEPEPEQFDSQFDVVNEGQTDSFTSAQDITDETAVTDIVIEDVDAKTEREDYSKQKVYDIVDEVPIFPGGDQALLEYISENLEYPNEAMNSGIQGRVFVQVIVEPDGSISNAKVIRGIGYGCDEEAVRVVESLPTFDAGKKKGKAVRVSYTIPVAFELP